MLSTILHTITAALVAHPAIAAWALATLAALYRSHTPAQWVAMGERIPRVQGLLRLARGAGLDPVRALEGAAQVVTGRVPVDPRDAEIAALREALAAYQRRTLDSHAVTLPFDPAARRITDGQRGSASLRVLLAVVVGFAVVLPVGVILTGCPASRQLTRPALGDVDGCEPRATRCSPTGRPQVCSGSRRWTDADAVCVTAGQVAAVCCLTTSPITGAELHACVTADRCIADGGR